MANQQEILDFLEKNKGDWYSVRDIMMVLNVKFVNNIDRKLAKMRQFGFIDYKVSFGKGGKVWLYKFNGSLDNGHGGG